MKPIRTYVAWLLVTLALGCAGITERKDAREEAKAVRTPSQEAAFLWEAYPEHRISPVNPAQLSHADLMTLLDTLAGDHPDIVHVSSLGKSVEGRKIRLVTVGRGPKKLLLWSQMHGDEPTATGALLDILQFLTKNPDLPLVQAILNECTLLIIPMLNPDGAERYTRRNAMDIDINRDARYLQTPEGKILKAAQEKFRPQFGFNLHDHGPREMVGRTKKVVTLSLLVPPFDYEETQNEVTLRAEKMAAFLHESVWPWCEGRVSRYRADYMPRAFGDSMQSWGVSTILLESGGWTDENRGELVRLNFVGLLALFHAIATDEYLRADLNSYRELLRSGEHPLFDVMISRVTVVNGLGHPPFVADLGINYALDAHSPEWRIRSASIQDLGDLRVTTGKQNLDGEDWVCVPGLITFRPEVSPSSLPDEKRIREWYQSGITTVVGHVNLADREEVRRHSRQQAAPLSLRFAGSVEGFDQQWSQAQREQLLYGCAQGLAAVYPEVRDATARRYLDWFNIPEIVPGAKILEPIPECLSLKDVPSYTSERAKTLGLRGQGVIRRGARADLLFFKKRKGFESEGLRLEDLEAVMIGGRMVYRKGESR